MKLFPFALAVLCQLCSCCFADDQSHPYSPSVYSSHSSLAPGSPKWFRPGYGYVLPESLMSQRSLVPYLSRRADAPFDPYDFRQVNYPERNRPVFNRTGRVWPVPGDVPGFRVDVLWGYGNLPSGAGFSR